MTRRWKVGELAQATGLTVRTLHHWDDKGLVTPSQRSASGHRLYTEADIERAYQVVALRELGLSLEAVGDVLAGAAPDLGDLLDAHVEQLGDDHIAQVQTAWPPLIAAVRAEMEAGTDPDDPRVAALAERWMQLLDDIDGGDPAIRENARRMITENPCEAQAGGAPAPELMDYIGRANAARG